MVSGNWRLETGELEIGELVDERWSSSPVWFSRDLHLHLTQVQVSRPRFFPSRELIQLNGVWFTLWVEQKGITH